MLKIHLYGKLRRLAENSKPTDVSVIHITWQPKENIKELVKRIGLTLEELGEVFVNHTPVEQDAIIPKDGRIGLFPKGMHLLCGGQHMKGHGYLTKKPPKSFVTPDYWTR